MRQMWIRDRLLASVISRRVKKMTSLKQMFLVMLLILPIVGLVGTNNLSTAIIIMGIAVILVFTASPKYLQFIAMGGLGVGFLAIFLSVESYRLERLAIWRNPEAYDCLLYTSGQDSCEKADSSGTGGTGEKQKGQKREAARF